MLKVESASRAAETLLKSSMITPILQTRKLSHREVKYLPWETDKNLAAPFSIQRENQSPCS